MFPGWIHCNQIFNNIRKTCRIFRCLAYRKVSLTTVIFNGKETKISCLVFSLESIKTAMLFNKSCLVFEATISTSCVIAFHIGEFYPVFILTVRLSAVLIDSRLNTKHDLLTSMAVLIDSRLNTKLTVNTNDYRCPLNRGKIWIQRFIVPWSVC
jgi:hypothetical protein